MTKELNEGTTFKLSIKTLAGIAALIFTLVSMWFVLQDVTRMEFDMKDQNIRLSIENTEKSVDEIKKDLRRMEDKIDQLR